MFTTGEGGQQVRAEAGRRGVRGEERAARRNVDGENGRLTRLVKEFISSVQSLLRLKMITCNSINPHSFSNSF